MLIKICRNKQKKTSQALSLYTIFNTQENNLLPNTNPKNSDFLECHFNQSNNKIELEPSSTNNQKKIDKPNHLAKNQTYLINILNMS